MQRAEESRQQNDQGIMAWLVTQHDDWLDKSVEDNVRELRLASEEVREDDNSKVFKTEDIQSLLKKIQDEHVDLEVSHNEEDQRIDVILSCLVFSMPLLIKTDTYFSDTHQLRHRSEVQDCGSSHVYRYLPSKNKIAC